MSAMGRDADAETEPQICAQDLRRVLNRAGYTKDDEGESVAILAERSGLSTRTVYRALDPKRDKPWALTTGDELLVAAGRHISEVRLIWPDGSID
jgi:hypothetical protein